MSALRFSQRSAGILPAVARASCPRTWCAVILALTLCSCARKPPADAVVVLIEFSPTSLDPRIGIDAQSERIDELLFDALVRRDEHFNLKPWLADSWDIPDPLTYIFHLHRGVHFHDGRPLTARDVKWTFDSVMNGTVRTPKTGTYRFVDRIDAPDDSTVIFHLKEPWSSLLWNVSNGAIGIVPYGSAAEMTANPVGSGPFRFVRNEQDREVEIVRNDDYWGPKPNVARVRFLVVPDSTTRALELRKGSADIAINSLTSDMVAALRAESNLEVLQTPGTTYAYLALNLRDPILKDARVRQAMAYAIDRRPMIRYLWRDIGEPADSVLPRQSWAYLSASPHYDYDSARANQLLDEAGYRRGRDGTRFHITMKISSSEESTRLLAAVLQQQWRAVGIALDIRTFEFATFFSDVTKGAFQLYSLRWIGGNDDPDIFEYTFESDRMPPKGANRGFYVNPEIDRLIQQGRSTVDLDERKRIYARVQEILALDLPYINLWYIDNVVVHSRRVQNFQISPSGNYDFLNTVTLQ